MNGFSRVEVTALEQRAAEYFGSYHDKMAARVDRMMAYLLAAEWLGAVVVAILLSPRTWVGTESTVHPHVWTALLLGPLIVCVPFVLAFRRPAQQFTRHVIAIAQILMSALLIDVTNGRIETHFHVFGSLAFLAFYRDWRVLITASAVTAIDHVVRGIWWPQSVYGILTVSPWRWAEHAWWVSFEDVFLIVSIRRSVGEMKTMALREAQLAYGAYHDVLTGLANRRLLKDRFNHCVAQREDTERKEAVMFVDLDRFKQVNDTLGHSVGDKLLSLVSERFTSVLRANDTIARVGGDEFVVVIERLASDEDAEKIGAKILGVFNLPFEVEGHELLLSASVGISLLPDHGTDLLVLQDAADAAMYEAKATGRNKCVVFSPELTRRERSRQELGRDLYHAIVRGEMEVYFQPQVGLNGEVSAFEALLRWRHPERGLVGPSEFIPIAEKSGLIVVLGNWVLERACQACREWHDAGYKDLTVAVNVSTVQFEQANFAESVARVLHEVGLEPSLLTLEVTESVLMKNLEMANEHLSRLRQTGVCIALDDFGTGYSSLSYLQGLPASTIKLDRSFVTREFADQPRVLESIIAMAHRIGMQVVAEGVETLQQREYLRDIACDQIQGFYYSEPLPSDGVIQYLAARAEVPRLKACG